MNAIAFGLLPVSVGIAVLKYRLYEIDRIVSRTVSYGLLTAGLIGVYLLVVALLRPLLEPLTGSSSLAVAASTLAVAAVFNPARRRLQAAVDRRFDRARYDAALAVEAFAARLRTQVDLDEITPACATPSPPRSRRGASCVAACTRAARGRRAVSNRLEFRRAAPWVLCAVSLSISSLSNVLRWTPEARRHRGRDWLEGPLAALGVAGIPVVGALIASRQPSNPSAGCGAGWVWPTRVSDVPPLVLAFGGPAWVAWLLEGWGFACLLGLMIFVFLLFPTGRLPSPPWRWLARAAVAGVLLAVVLVPLAADPSVPGKRRPWAVHGQTGRSYSGAAAVYGDVRSRPGRDGLPGLRFRRAGPGTATAHLVPVRHGLIVAYLVLDAVGVIPPGLLSSVLNAATFAVLPVAVGVAVFRYRLYEIDRIVSRTVSYGLLTAALIGLYLLVVALLRPLLEPLTGNSSLAVAASTLAVAAVFNPARRRLQAAVDRRFDRARYDAALAVQAFAARLRTQVDLDQITAGLCDTVVATVAPGRVSVWLRPAERG